ncbi:hypothetical protein PM082_007111 [Marasmius tenuissimus]|nr:hypothetical protein PM082_007111 [Marasmius tenuissimus]
MKFTLLSITSLASAVAAKNCAKCASTIFYSGQTRSLTSQLQSSGTAQCNYGSPIISGFNPYCLYNNNDGSLVLTNTGGACPSFATVVVVSSSETCNAFP